MGKKPFVKKAMAPRPPKKPTKPKGGKKTYKC
jgi:hypothetical protein